MIHSLRKKFIRVSALSIVIVVLVLFGVMAVMNHIQLNRTMDTLTDAIADNDGVFPELDPSMGPLPSERNDQTGVITEETRFSTRFFTVWLDEKGEATDVNMDSISSVSEETAGQYAKKALAEGTERGWVDDCRFRIFQSEENRGIVFVNGAMHRTMANRFLFSTLLILGVSGLIMLVLFILISGRVVRPVAESYEKQKQFITDAGHELKTPLTLILTNVDIVEYETGENEWLEDIRSEGQRMSMLISQLVTLSRMDEPRAGLSFSQFDLSSAVTDTVSEFAPLAAERGKRLSAETVPELMYRGDEGMIRRLVAILLDNAVKYSDEGGEIRAILYVKRHPVIVVENTCEAADELELDRFFDRFYRGDRARTFDGSFGLGLSIARAIARNHHGDISAYRKEKTVGFRVELK